MTSGTVEPVAPPEPAAPIPPQPVGQVTASDVQAAAAPKTPFDVLMEYLDKRFSVMDDRLNQQGTAIVKLAEAYTPQGRGTLVQEQGGMSQIGDIINILKQALGSESGSPSIDSVYREIGKNVFDKSLQGVVNRVVKVTASESASHVTGQFG